MHFLLWVLLSVFFGGAAHSGAIGTHHAPIVRPADSGGMMPGG